MVILGLQKDFCENFKNKVSERFQISSYGDLNWFLNIKIEQTENEMKQSQEDNKISEHNLINCETFQLNELRKLPVPKDSGTRASEALEIVHTDILGPIQPEAVDGHTYAIGFVDSFSRYQKLYFLRSRDEAFEKVEQLFADIGQPGTLVCDGAGEYVSNDIKHLCRQKGVKLEFSAPYTPQENGKVERNWGTIPQWLDAS